MQRFLVKRIEQTPVDTANLSLGMTKGKQGPATPQKPAAPPPKTLLDKQDIDDGTNSGSRRRKPRSIEEQVYKSLLDNFKGWTERQADCVHRQGLSLREVLLRDKQLANQGALTMGKRTMII
jgi:hypothetical protein